MHAYNRNEQVTVITKMSAKKTSKTVVKSEVTTLASKKRKRGKDNDGDGSAAEDDDTYIRSASAAVKKE
jgi:hypothetical protein